MAATSETATYIIYNASIYTGDPRDSQQVFTAIAFNTKTGTILGIGDDTTILSKFSESAATQENAHGKAIVPGFIDSHTARNNHNLLDFLIVNTIELPIPLAFD